MRAAPTGWMKRTESGATVAGWTARSAERGATHAASPSPTRSHGADRTMYLASTTPLGGLQTNWVFLVRLQAGANLAHDLMGDLTRPVA